MGALEELRAILGDDVTDADLRALLTKHVSVEAAANAFFDGLAHASLIIASLSSPSTPNWVVSERFVIAYTPLRALRSSSDTRASSKLSASQDLTTPTPRGRILLTPRFEAAALTRLMYGSPPAL